jgi:hypothetical protein
VRGAGLLGVIRPEEGISPPFSSSRFTTSPIPEQKNASSLEDETEGVEKTLLSKVIRT